MPLPDAPPDFWSQSPLPPRCGLLSPASADLPLAGLTLLLVEDSRFAADGLRLVAQRMGARLRRAETLAQARHHLGVYRPDAVIVDLGLPDGRGEDLIAEIRRQGGPPVLGLSGDDTGLARARRAGAAGFLAKPLGGMAEVCRAILALLPERMWLARGLAEAPLPPADPLALRDDFAAAARRLAQDGAGVAGFVEGVARAAEDDALARLAGTARDEPQAIGDLARALAARLAPPAAVAPP